MTYIMADLIAKLSQKQITDFFSTNAPLTQQQCDQEAERRINKPVHPTVVQGANSYTLVSDDNTYVIQFRLKRSVMDIQLLKCVEQAYNGFTPRHQYLGDFGDLPVYGMDNVGGISMYLARNELHHGDPSLLRQTVSDFARFFASAWHNTPGWMECPNRSTLHDKYRLDLMSLRRGLPERFIPTLDKLLLQLPRLFDVNWPLVPHHTDLLENNIHVSKETGHIKGICDWRDTAIGPFGVSLGGLETMLGFWSLSEGWVYHANQQELRDLFWGSFYEAIGEVSNEQKELIEVARVVGLFLDNGFIWEDMETKVPVPEGADLRFLEAATLKLWALPSKDAQ